MTVPPDRTDLPRVAANATPRKHAGESKTGALVLIGGACTPRGHALRRFFDLSDATGGGAIVALTTASATPEENAWYWTGAFKSVGATNVQIPMFERDNKQRDREIATMIDAASGVFLGGGDQVKLVASLSGTCSGEA